MNNNNPDLLSFKEFPPVHGIATSTNNYPTAQISINSPQKTKAGSNMAKDPLEELINDMSHSVRVLDEQQNDGNLKQQQLSPDEQETVKKTLSPLNIEFYQQFFNVDTLMVVERIAASMIPKRAPPNYLKSTIGLNPDLYGPFWIIVTLIFSIAISGNIANYLQTYNENESYHWHYNFHLVSYAATTLFIYACFVPGALWALFKWSLKPIESDLEMESAEFTPSLLSLMCVYGYSLAIYIPVSILWVIPYSVLQWILVLTAAFLSGSVLIFVLTPALRNSKYSLFLMSGIIAAHFLLAAGFMLYFFHAPGYKTQNYVPKIEIPAPLVHATQAAIKANITK